MHKSWQALYQRRASIQTSEVLSSPGFSNMPNIFASAKYFFLWPFQVYYRRRGGILSRFPLEFCREPSLSPEGPSGDISAWEPFPGGGCWPSPRPTPGTSHPRTASPARPQEPGAACSEPSSLLKRAEHLPDAVGHGEFSRAAAAQKLSGKGLRPEGAARTGSGHPPPTPATAGSTNPDPSLIHTGAPMAPEPPHPAVYFCHFPRNLISDVWEQPSEH